MGTSREMPSRSGVRFIGDAVSASAALNAERRSRTKPGVTGVPPLSRDGVLSSVSSYGTRVVLQPSELVAEPIPWLRCPRLTWMRPSGGVSCPDRLARAASRGGVGRCTLQLQRHGWVRPQQCARDHVVRQVRAQPLGRGVVHGLEAQREPVVVGEHGWAVGHDPGGRGKLVGPVPGLSGMARRGVARTERLTRR